ncbi:hypothetical protein FUA23_10375 [Neolewinella aurantiaca]|uniref:Uncharacterized protein n=1 Tax=Neolewinella aurantiaca TaxID=2602767 RepID=A0A5C7FSW3_9BACT|nr:hypothetical protein [Neolewinella aurantiaca]TXF89365.1 hypothetical protein FUA23_10375 [Neolewinella aurantiaca]
MSKTTPALYEFIWWAFTLVLAGLVLLPVYTQLPEFQHLVPNFVYIVVAVTFTRYLFFLDISWLRDHLLIQGALSILLLPLIFWMVQYLNSFILFFDEKGPDVLIQHLDKDTGTIMNRYLKTEYRFFSIWAIIATAIMPFRLLFNVWKRYGAGVRKL